MYGPHGLLARYPRRPATSLEARTDALGDPKAKRLLGLPTDQMIAHDDRLGTGSCGQHVGQNLSTLLSLELTGTVD